MFFALQGFGVKFMLDGTREQRIGLLVLLLLVDSASIAICLGCKSYLQRMMRRLGILTLAIGADITLVDQIRRTLVASMYLGALLILVVSAGDILLYALLK